MVQGPGYEGLVPRNGIDVTRSTACPKDTELFLIKTGQRAES